MSDYGYLARTTADSDFISMTIDEAGFQRFLESLEDDIEDFYQDWLRKMGAWTLREALLSFDRQAEPGGIQYPELSPKYAWRKLMHSRSLLANIWSGALRRSLQLEMEGTGLHKKGTVGSDKPYAGFIQTGTHKTPGPLPARPYLPATAYARRHGKQLAESLIKHVTEG